MTKPTPAPTPAPEPSDWEEAAHEEALFRRVMQYATDQLWTLGAHELGMAVLHDVLDDAEARKARQNPHEPLPK